MGCVITYMHPHAVWYSRVYQILQFITSLQFLVHLEMKKKKEKPTSLQHRINVHRASRVNDKCYYG